MSVAVAARLTGLRSQETFDVLMRTLAEPGKILALPASVLSPDIANAAWPVLAVADVDVPIAVQGPDADAARSLANLISDTTGANQTPLPQAWGVVLTEPTPSVVDEVAVGDALHPEKGARVAMAVTQLGSSAAGAPPLSETNEGESGTPQPVTPAADSTVTLELSGPGIPGARNLTITGLDPAVAARLGRNSGIFPAGFDTWLVDDYGAITAISRSTHVHLSTHEEEQ